MMNRFRWRRKQLQQQVRRLRSRLIPGAVILLYHRIAPKTKDTDPWELCVTPEHFAEHLEVLNTYTHPLSLQQLAQAHQAQTLPSRAVAITFDDGYANNLEYGKPLLQQYNIPATVFVITGYLQDNREFWWDELDQLLLQPGQLPPKLSLNLGGNVRQWTLEDASDYTEDHHRQDCDRHTQSASLSQRFQFYTSVWQSLLPLSEGQRRQALADIATWAKVQPVARPTHRSLRLEELEVVQSGDLMNIGAHTVTHPLLSTCTLDCQYQEILQSKATLETILGHAVPSFSYPFGAYTRQTVPLLRKADFTYACSTIVDSVWRYSDRFQLPRIEVKDWDGDQFAQWLLQWFPR